MKTLRRFKPYFPMFKPVGGELVVALVCGLIAGALGGAGIPVILYKIVPVVFEDRNLTTTDLWFYCLLPAMVMGGRGLTTFFSNYYLAYCGQTVLEKIRINLFAKLQRLPLSFYHKNPPGELVSRAMSDSNVVQQSIITITQEVIRQPATLVFAIGMLAFLSMKHEQVIYLMIFMVAIPVCIVPVQMIGKKMKKKASSLQFELADATNRICENLEATQEIRAYNLEERENEKFTQSASRVFTGFMKLAKYNTLISPIIEFIGALGVGVGLYYTYKSQIDEGAFTALLAALYMCYEPVKRLGRLNNSMQAGIASLERIEHILDEDEVIHDPESPKNFPAVVTGQITFDNVSFAYADEPVLRGVSMSIEAGKTYALVGPSGAGKTTFANLILRYYDVTDGAVRVEGIDVRDLRQNELRSQISVVAQSPVLFNDSIAGNIAVGAPDATQSMIEDAARQAYAHDFIMAMPDGYKTQVGPSGARLSGGQRQRIALARAFLKKAPILILDEATSALDAESERYIQLAMERLSEKKTVIVIAHRFSSIQRADEILVFQQGQIVDQGSHSELLSRDGLYKNLYIAQGGEA
ncbi:ABC transporter ATP-binding protein [Cerasicoccus fimbriatus]|uniref:ABC transporter ATP-binding protein n=1 Tax=Cerasicoccus fimbriatus TaxID=3014554 RepID=UPI0022B2F244|nr:ABC transporter ATP-binding protein [Cerasicoccus sp. TK19100]